jgi:hypothetical protein
MGCPSGWFTRLDFVEGISLPVWEVAGQSEAGELPGTSARSPIMMVLRPDASRNAAVDRHRVADTHPAQLVPACPVAAYRRGSFLIAVWPGDTPTTSRGPLGSGPAGAPLRGEFRGAHLPIHATCRATLARSKPTVRRDPSVLEWLDVFAHCLEAAAPTPRFFRLPIAKPPRLCLIQFAKGTVPSKLPHQYGLVALFARGGIPKTLKGLLAVCGS